MAIYDEERMKQKPVYPTKQTPSYADWRLFQMGKELENSIPSGLTVDQEVIAGSTNAVSGGAVKTYVDTEVAGVNEVPDSTAADVNKILTVDANGEPNWSTPLTPQVTVDQSVIAGSTNPVAGGAVKTYVDAIAAGYAFEGEYTVQYTADYDIIDNYDIELAQEYLNKDILVIVEAVSNYMQIENACYSNSRVILLATYNSALNTSCTVTYSLYTRNKIQTQNSVIIIGATGIKYNKVPDSSTTDADKVLTVGSTGYPEWQTPSGSGGGITGHTFNSFGEMYTALVNNPGAIIRTTIDVHNISIGWYTVGESIAISMLDISRYGGTDPGLYISHDRHNINSSDLDSSSFDRMKVSFRTTAGLSIETSTLTYNINKFIVFY